MAFTFSNARRLSPEESNPLNALLSRAMQTFGQGLNLSYLPREKEAEIAQKQAQSQKNMIISQLMQSMLGGNGQPASAGTGNLNPAILKAFTGVDPYLMSPQESQNLKIKGALQQQANRANLATGSSDVVRELLQNKVSMPKEYMGAFGSASMLKDRIAAQLGDKNAIERLEKAAVAERLVPEYSGAQLSSQGIKPTVSALQHQQEAIRQGWPYLSKGLKFVPGISGNLPPELQKEVEKKHNEIIKAINQGRRKFLESGGEERPSSDVDLSSLSEEELIKIADGQ